MLCSRPSIRSVRSSISNRADSPALATHSRLILILAVTPDRVVRMMLISRMQAEISKCQLS
jgi:hypothetical protein